MDTPGDSDKLTPAAANQIRQSFDWAWDHARFHPDDRSVIIPILCGLICMTVGAPITEAERLDMERRVEVLVAIQEAHAGLFDDDPFI